MSLLDNLRSLANTLPGEAKPLASELSDIVGALVHLIENADDRTGVVPPATSAPAAGDEPETVGSMVFDAAADQADKPAGTPELTAVDDPAPAGQDELEAEIAAKQDELQSLQVKLADSRRTRLEPPSPETP